MIASDREQEGEVWLHPLERFDHAALHHRPGNIVPAEADNQMNRILRKACAGLRYGLRTTGARFRQAFISGEFGRNDLMVLEWTIRGMREELFPTWHGLCALTVYELARGMRLLGPTAGGFAWYLNQWAEDPLRPLPSVAGWTLFLRDLATLPDIPLEMREGDPRRRDVPEFNFSILDVDGLLYSVRTPELRRIQATRDETAGRRPVGDAREQRLPVAQPRADFTEPMEPM